MYIDIGIDIDTDKDIDIDTDIEAWQMCATVVHPCSEPPPKKKNSTPLKMPQKGFRV